MSIDNYPLIPKDAFLYFPDEREQCLVKNEQPYRIIFEGGVIYTSFEKDKLAQLHSQMKKQKKYNHLSYMPEPTLMRFLQATKYDMEDCLQQLRQYKKWEESIFPLTLQPKIQTLLRQGYLYMCGRDNKYRPIIVIDVKKVKEANLKEKTFCDLMGFFYQYVAQNCLLEGQIESWITITDLLKMGLFSLGGTVMDTIKFMSSHFRCRAHHNYLVNCPGSMTFLYGMIKSTLKEDQIAKITLCEQSQIPRQAFDNISQNQIEVKYGGKMPDLQQFWPIKCPQLPPNRQRQEKLVTIKQYGRMHENGELSFKKVSKDILQEYQKIPQSKSQTINAQGKENYYYYPEEPNQDIYQLRLITNKKLKDSTRKEKENSQQRSTEPTWENPPPIDPIPPPFAMIQLFTYARRSKTQN